MSIIAVSQVWLCASDGPLLDSDALRDFLRGSNRGRHVWFVEDTAALEAKLAA